MGSGGGGGRGDPGAARCLLPQHGAAGDGAGRGARSGRLVRPNRAEFAAVPGLNRAALSRP